MKSGMVLSLRLTEEWFEPGEYEDARRIAQGWASEHEYDVIDDTKSGGFRVGFETSPDRWREEIAVMNEVLDELQARFVREDVLRKDLREV